jgi:hypothetical protein
MAVLCSSQLLIRRITMAKNSDAPSVSLDADTVSVTKPPVVEAPPRAVESTVRVHVIKDVNNVFIGGTRYTFKKGTQADIPVEVAYTLRSDGSVI